MKTAEPPRAAAEVFLGRQPIFDRSRRAYGYEILFRSGNVATADVVDGDRATATVMLNALTEIGLERLVGRRKAWVNVTREAVLSGLGLMLPPGVTCFEILEDQLVDADLTDAVRELKDRGYAIALDDFTYSPEQEPLLKLADFVKLDYMTLGPEAFATQMALVAGFDVKIVAEKVETHTEHEHCLTLGCDFFQGYFYQRPEVLRERRIELANGSVLQLIAALQDPDLELDDLEPMIALNVGLSVRLMRYLNSAFLGLPKKVSSVRHGLLLLGVENVRRWATLTAMSCIENKTPELAETALLRARFCEMAAAEAGLDGSKLFTVGLFSLLDAMLDTTIEEALHDLPFPADVRQAIVDHSGPMGEILRSVIALEHGEQPPGDADLAGSGQIYTEALIWLQEAAGSLEPA